FINANGLGLLEIDAGAGVVGQPWTELWPIETRGLASDAVTTALNGSVARFSGFFPTAKGKVKWWDVVVSPVPTVRGDVERLMIVSRDVTAQAVIEQTLRTSERYFKALANNIPQLAWMADRTGALFWYNERWFDYTGTTLPAMAGWGWQAVHHPDHVDRVVKKFSKSVETGEPWEDLFPLRRADGVYRWFLSRAMPLRDADGRIEFWCGTNTDITEQRNQSHRLRQLARIIDISHEAILVREHDDGIVLWNRGCEDLYGFDKAAAIGANVHQLLKPRQSLTQSELDHMILTEGSWSGEILYTASDGSDVWVDSRQELIRIAGTKLVLETSRDISDRRKADETHALLVGELNHRVKNTLAIVQSIATQTARSTCNNQAFVENFNGRLQSLASAHNVLTDAHWSGASILELVKSQISVAGGPLSRVDLAGEDVYLPPQIALHMALLLHELATNAVRHGALSNADGRIAIAWRTVSGSPPLLDLDWRDSGGPSVSAAFAPVRGFGLSLIERSNRLPNLKASITLKGNGAAAHLVAELLPDHRASEQLFNPGKSLMKRRSLDRPARREPRKRILILDGAPGDAAQLEEMLYDAGYMTVGPVATVADVLRKFALVMCDLVIVDVEGTSPTDIRSILADAAKRHIPFVALGSIADLDPLDVGRLSGVIAKPLNELVLLSTVAKVLAAP
ncbi:MAG: PAS domain S-box protein, partial [Hyphomicrobium sp.]